MTAEERGDAIQTLMDREGLGPEEADEELERRLAHWRLLDRESRED